jgi:dethiobiotin synthetase
MAVFFMTAIDTGVGKTVVTGLVARYLATRGRRVITQKLAQTGCHGLSEDIAEHRALAGMAMTAEDEQGLTCPYVFDYPASPHLAAAMEGKCIDADVIRGATDQLAARYEDVVIEGVGGIEVPMTETMTTLDYIAARGYPVIVVSTPRLGSINHTLLTLRALRTRGLVAWGIVYNRAGEQDRQIADDSRAVFARALHADHGGAWIIDVPAIGDRSRVPDIDWSPLMADVEGAS